MREGSSAVHCKLQGKGDAILFIHGMPTNHKLWDEVIGQLSCNHRCFAVDLPGMGSTPFAPYRSDYLDRMATQIDQLRIQHGVKKWHVVGHDAGAAIAVQYASRFERNVGCLVLLSPAIFPELKPFYLLNPLRKPLLGEVLAPLVHFIFWQIAMRRAIDAKANRASLRTFRKPFSGIAGAWRFMRLVRWGRPEDMLRGIPAILAELSMPTLVLHGTRDVLPASFAERAASLIPNSTLVTLDAGHFVPIERPNEVANCVRRFIHKNREANPRPIQTLKTKKRLANRRIVAPAATNCEMERPAAFAS
jgi:pimeloyl-ACP methyl ester carboxylesterase